MQDLKALEQVLEMCIRDRPHSDQKEHQTETRFPQSRLRGQDEHSCRETHAALRLSNQHQKNRY